MDCDIHMYAEVKRTRNDMWGGVLGGRMNPGRNYLLFGRLAGVGTNGPAVVEPRGIPDDTGWGARGDYWLHVSEEAGDADGFCTPESAERYVGYGSKAVRRTDGTILRVEHPDWHTPTWLLLSEYEQALRLTEEDAGGLVWPLDLAEYHAVASALGSMEAQGYETRVVFWFDN